MRWVQGFQNIRNTPDLPRHSVRRAAAAMRECHAVGFAEISEHGQDAADVQSGLGPQFQMRRASTSTPQAFRGKLKPVWDGAILLNEGDSKVPIPRRHITEVIVKRKWHPRSPKLVTLCAHQVAGAWNGKDPSRQPLWNSQAAIIAARVDYWIGQGYNVLLIDDANRVNVDYRHPRIEAWGHNGIDKMILFTAKGYRGRLVRRWKENTPSDHDAIFAEFELKRV